MRLFPVRRIPNVAFRCALFPSCLRIETRPQRSTESGDDYDRALLSDSAKSAANASNDKIRFDRKLSQELVPRA